MYNTRIYPRDYEVLSAEIFTEIIDGISESNMKYLEKVISDIDEGRAKLVEHDIIEVDE